MEKQKLDKDEVKKIVMERIRAGDNYKQTRKFLDNSGILYQGLKTTFYTWKKEINPVEDRDNAIHSVSEKRRAKKEKQNSVFAHGTWSKQKQKAADESALAVVLNDAMFQFIPCPHKELKKEDVQEINVGGSIIGLVSYYTNINLDHPIIIFVTRALLLVIKVRALCYAIQKKVEDVKGKLDMKLHHTQL